jgi:hypothetical protein
LATSSMTRSTRARPAPSLSGAPGDVARLLRSLRRGLSAIRFETVKGQSTRREQGAASRRRLAKTGVGPPGLRELIDADLPADELERLVRVDALLRAAAVRARDHQEDAASLDWRKSVGAGSRESISSWDRLLETRPCRSACSSMESLPAPSRPRPRRRRRPPRHALPTAALSADSRTGIDHDRTLEITFLAPGAEAYAFTFG